MSLHSISFFLHWENQKDRFPPSLRGEGFSLASCRDIVLVFQGRNRGTRMIWRNRVGLEAASPQKTPTAHATLIQHLTLKIFLNAGYLLIPGLGTNAQQ